MLERKPWQPLEAATVAKVPGTLGVYQLADADGNVLYIGVANLQYTTRWIELLDGFLAQHGQLPLGNVAAPEELPPSVRRRLTARR